MPDEEHRRRKQRAGDDLANVVGDWGRWVDAHCAKLPLSTAARVELTRLRNLSDIYVDEWRRT